MNKKRLKQSLSLEACSIYKDTKFSHEKKDWLLCPGINLSAARLSKLVNENMQSF